MTTKYLKSETPKMHVVNTTLLIPSYIYTCMKVYHKFEITHTKTINFIHKWEKLQWMGGDQGLNNPSLSMSYEKTLIKSN